MSHVAGWMVSVPLIILFVLMLWVATGLNEEPDTDERDRDIEPVESGVWRHADGSKCTSYPDASNFTYVGPNETFLCGHGLVMHCHRAE